MSSDITVYKRLTQVPKKFLSAKEKASQTTSWNRTVVLEGDQDEIRFRALVCRCFAGKEIAITARSTARAEGEIQGEIAAPAPVTPPELACWPSDKKTEAAKKNDVDNQPGLDAIFELLKSVREPPWRGIVVFAGETGSRKTTYLRGIALRYVAPLLKGDRVHIVTYEDPIESWFASTAGEASSAGFDYTPRQRGIDVTDVQQATMDALRQRPSLFLVSEVRQQNDWRALLNFAGTGHFAMTTTHAGSLTETLERIVSAAKAKTPAERSELANRIVAIVHLRRIDKEHVVPAMWLQTAYTRTAFIQEGLGAILPQADGCYGRAYFAEKLELSETLQSLALREDLGGR